MTKTSYWKHVGEFGVVVVLAVIFICAGMWSEAKSVHVMKGQTLNKVQNMVPKELHRASRTQSSYQDQTTGGGGVYLDAQPKSIISFTTNKENLNSVGAENGNGTDFKLNTDSDAPVLVPKTRERARHRIALISATHDRGTMSMVQQRSLSVSNVLPQNEPSELWERRKQFRRIYCTLHHCDVVWDTEQYHINRTMQLQMVGGVTERGPMPPYWNKAFALQKALPHYDYVVLLDADCVWTDFTVSIQDLVEQLTDDQVALRGEPAAIIVKNSHWGRRLVDLWVEYGTGDGCRYHKYPYNHMYQTINADMPWWWFAQTKILEEYYNVTIPCLDPCAGPDTYVDNLGKLGKTLMDKHQATWIAKCYDMTTDYTPWRRKVVVNNTWVDPNVLLLRKLKLPHGRVFMLDLQYGDPHYTPANKSLAKAVIFNLACQRLRCWRGIEPRDRTQVCGD